MSWQLANDVPSEAWRRACLVAAVQVHDLGLHEHAGSLRQARTLEDGFNALGLLEVSLDAVARCASHAGHGPLAERARLAGALVFEAFEECLRASGTDPDQALVEVCEAAVMGDPAEILSRPRGGDR